MSHSRRTYYYIINRAWGAQVPLRVLCQVSHTVWLSEKQPRTETGPGVGGEGRGAPKSRLGSQTMKPGFVYRSRWLKTTDNQTIYINNFWNGDRRKKGFLAVHADIRTLQFDLHYREWMKGSDTSIEQDRTRWETEQLYTICTGCRWRCLKGARKRRHR